MNIIWQQPSGAIAVTYIFNSSNPEEHAATLKNRGNIPSDWVLVSTNYTGNFPSSNQDTWRWVGGVIVEGSPVVPKAITALQGLLAIDQYGLSSEYEAWANDPARTFAQRAFINKAQTWNRDDATLNDAATSLGLSSSQVDSMFIWAANQ